MRRNHTTMSRPNRSGAKYNRVSLIVVVVAITSIVVWFTISERVAPIPMMQIITPGPP
jgi:hypothetical protein